METKINIDGMVCQGCVAIVNDALSETKGINNVNVSLDNKNAVVDYDENTINKEEIEKVIEKAGYKIVK